MNRIIKAIKANNIVYYLIVFFVIVILIISVMGGYLYRFYYKTFYEDFLTTSENHVISVMNQHENNMQLMDDIVTQMNLSEDFIRFKLEEKPEKSFQLKECLERYTTVSQFFNLLIYNYQEDDYLFHYASSYRKEAFIEFGCILENTSVEELRQYMYSTDKKWNILSEQNVRYSWITRYFSNYQTVIYKKSIPPKYVDSLLFFVPDTYYDSLLNDNSADTVDFIFYDNQIIVSRGAGNLEENSLISLIQSLENEQEKVVLEEEEYLLTLKKGKSGLVYGTMQSMKNFHDKFKSEQWKIISLLLMCAIPATFAIVVISGNIMRKIRSLNTLLNEEDFYNLNSIESGIQTLVMNHQAVEAESKLLKKTKFIRNFIRNDFKYRNDAIEEAHNAGLQIDYKSYVVILMGSREENDENQAYSLILDMIEADSKVGGYGVHLINNNRSLLVLFADEEEAMEDVLRQLLVIGKKYCADCVVAISNYHSNFAESSKAYLEADRAFDNHLLIDNGNIIRFADVIKNEYVSRLPENSLQNLKYVIRMGNREGVESVISDICTKMYGENASLYSFRILCNDIIQILLSEWNDDTMQFGNLYNVFTLSQCLSIQDFHDLLCDICRYIIERREGKAICKSDIVHEAVEWMQRNFADSELTMNALAEHLGVSPVTLAVEFKNELDIRPSDYLANLRMEHAKELLKNTNMLVREISTAVGYEDDHVFMRRFKKHTGMTPGQYRAE